MSGPTSSSSHARTRCRREQFPKLGDGKFCGGIDTQHIFPHGTPQQVRDEVCRVIEILAPGGGYMLAAVHTIMDEVPPANIMAMVDATREFGSPFRRT